VTRAQRKVLANIQAGRPYYHGFDIKTYKGGLTKTVKSLQAKGWTDNTGAITSYGEAALLEAPKQVKHNAPVLPGSL